MSFYRQMLKAILFPQKVVDGLALLSELEPAGEEHRATSTAKFPIDGASGTEQAQQDTRRLPSDAIPETCEVKLLASGEAYFSDMATALSNTKSTRLFISPQLTRRNRLSDRVKGEYPGMDAEAMALELAAKTLRQGTLVAALVTPNFLSSIAARPARERIFGSVATTEQV